MEVSWNGSSPKSSKSLDIIRQWLSIETVTTEDPHALRNSHITTKWCPPVISWFINPFTSLLYLGNWTRARLGAPQCRYPTLCPSQLLPTFEVAGDSQLDFLSLIWRDCETPATTLVGFHRWSTEEIGMSWICTGISWDMMRCMKGFLKSGSRFQYKNHLIFDDLGLPPFQETFIYIIHSNIVQVRA